MPNSENIPEGKDYVGFYLSKAVHKKLRRFAADSATHSKSEIVENSLREYFEQHKDELDDIID